MQVQAAERVTHEHISSSESSIPVSLTSIFISHRLLFLSELHRKAVGFKLHFREICEKLKKMFDREVHNTIAPEEHILTVTECHHSSGKKLSMCLQPVSPPRAQPQNTISLVLRSSHWLPVRHRIDFKVLPLVSEIL